MDADSSAAERERKTVRIDGRGSSLQRESMRRLRMEEFRLDAVPLGGRQ